MTSVGATSFIDYKLCGEEEAAHFTVHLPRAVVSRGGLIGFQATWQDAAVQDYFKAASQLPPTSACNNTGRGSPDVSALGQGYLVTGDLSVASAKFAAKLEYPSSPSEFRFQVQDSVRLQEFMEFRPDSGIQVLEYDRVFIMESDQTPEPDSRTWIP